MSTELIVAFIISFAVGPALCAVFLRMQGRTAVLLGLAAVTAVCMLLALRLQAQTGGTGLVSLGSLWLAWISAVAMVAMALRRLAPTFPVRRWLTIGALLATTLPWFGLATAQLLA